MVDYARLLRGVIQRKPYDVATRAAIYNRARSALVTELRKAQFSGPDVTLQRLLLEDAIREVERAALNEFLATR